MKKKKTLKIILYVIAASSFLLFLLGWFTGGNDGKTSGTGVSIPGTTSDERFKDSNLLYGTLMSSGLCGKENGEQGGCDTEEYLFMNGKFVTETGFTSEKTMKREVSISEKQFDSVFMERIKKEIADSGIMKKNCPEQKVMDAGWYYQIRLNGATISLHNPPAECRSVLAGIETLLSNESGASARQQK